jgi:hypothetical protein
MFVGYFSGKQALLSVVPPLLNYGAAVYRGAPNLLALRGVVGDNPP